MIYGILLIATGLIWLIWRVNGLAAGLVAGAAIIYATLYTPLKMVTVWNTPIGAIAGAIPPLVGWASATGELDTRAWLLFLILFAWQHPHFYAIAWLFRDDYARAGFKMLPVVAPDGKRTFRLAVAYSLLLLFVSLLPCAWQMAGYVYLAGASALGIMLVALSIRCALICSQRNAQLLFHASLLYLPLLSLLILLNYRTI